MGLEQIPPPISVELLIRILYGATRYIRFNRTVGQRELHVVELAVDSPIRDKLVRAEPIKIENFVFEMSKHASCFAGDLNERKRDGVRGGKDKICVSSF